MVFGFTIATNKKEMRCEEALHHEDGADESIVVLAESYRIEEP